MRVIIAGSRTITDYSIVEKAVRESGLADQTTEVVCGMARGVDMLGRRWAMEHKIPVKEFPADWNRLGKSAGFVRNGLMEKYAAEGEGGPEGGALIAVTTGSLGTKDMIASARRSGLKVWVKEVPRR